MMSSEYWYEMERLENVRREIELHLGRMLLATFKELYPEGVRYRFEVFDSGNGDDDWEYPVAVNLWCDDLGVSKDDPLYALCDATAADAWEQALYLYDQLLDEATGRGVITS